MATESCTGPSFSVRDTGKKQNTRRNTVGKRKYCAVQKTKIKIVRDTRGGLDSVYIFQFIFTGRTSVRKKRIRVDGIVRLEAKLKN